MVVTVMAFLNTGVVKFVTPEKVEREQYGSTDAVLMRIAQLRGEGYRQVSATESVYILEKDDSQSVWVEK